MEGVGLALLCGFLRTVTVLGHGGGLFISIIASLAFSLHSLPSIISKMAEK